jgi:hypothetical protein
MKSGTVFVFTIVLGVSPAIAQKPAIVAPPPTQARNVVVDTDYLIGMWSDQPDCSGSVIDLRRDGTFVNLDQSHGTWRLGGDMLTLAGTSTITVRIVRRSNVEMTVVNPDGSQGYSRRCIGPNRPMAQ